MATKSFSFIAAVVSLTFVVGCVSQTRRGPSIPSRPSPGAPVSDQAEEDFPNAATTPPPPQPSAPAPAPMESGKKVAVILGPGGAKAFAHIGVLKALQQNRVPIDKVVGLEWGALIGGLFASKGQVHDLEWKLYKMEQSKLPYSKGLFNSRGPGEQSSKVMDGFIQESLGREDMSKAKIEFNCPSRTIWTGVVAWQTRGLFPEAVKRCLPYPPVFKPQGTFIAGATAVSEAVERLIKEGFNVIIVVNVLGSGMPFAQDGLLDNLNHVILWQEVKRSVTEAAKYNVDMINVDTSSVPVVEFSAKKDLIIQGEKAGHAAAAALISKYRF
jgi:NTE family protein